MSDDDDPPSEEDFRGPDLERVGSQLFNDTLDRFVGPEMTRREETGEWPAKTAVYRFQVLLPPEGPVEVRLNEEVGGHAFVKVTRPVDAGEEVTTDDFSAVTDYTPRPEDADTPHVTGFAHSAGWSLAFQFGYRHPRRHDFLQRGREFAVTAREAHAAGRVGVALDAAFSATELFAKAELLSCAPTIAAALAARTHGSVREPYNLWGRLGNTNRRFVRLLNRLEALRAAARYLDGDLGLKSGEPQSLMEDLTAMESHVEEVAAGDLRDVAENGYNVIATRDVFAGQLVGPRDFTLRPPKER